MIKKVLIIGLIFIAINILGFGSNLMAIITAIWALCVAVVNAIINLIGVIL